MGQHREEFEWIRKTTFKITSKKSACRFDRAARMNTVALRPSSTAPSRAGCPGAGGVANFRKRDPLIARRPGSGEPSRTRRVIACGSGASGYPIDDVRTGPLARGEETDTVKSVLVPLATWWRFSRPHTMLGTFISIVSVSMLAVTSMTSMTSMSSMSSMTSAVSVVSASSVTPVVASTIASALVPALLMNISIVGLNQIYDVEIDKTNKPYLPIASGELSIGTAWRIVCATAILSLALGLLTGSLPLICTLVGSLVLGIAYSVDAPMLRWKRYPTVAAMCILSVRAVLVQFGFFFHMQRAMAAATVAAAATTTAVAASTTPLSQEALYFATAFMFVFSIVIALFKDIPDARGDKMNDMRTFTVRLGAKTVFWACIALLELAYASGVVYSLVRLEGWARIGSAAAHALVGGLVLKRAGRTDVGNPEDVYGCYMDIWKAFYFEYILIPLLGLTL